MSDDAILREKQRRLRELKEQQARYGIDTVPQIKTEIEDLEAEIAKLDGSAARAGLPRPPQPDFAHPYPIQSGFTGRVAERKMLTGWLGSSPQPVLAVIGIGGMGKSALSWAWLQRDVLGMPLPGASPDAPADSAACRLPEAARPEGVLWWSFYETQAGFASFLDEAIGYAGDGAINPRDLPSSYDKARALLSLLQQRRMLLVLDGFERELRAYSSLGAAYQGDVVDKQPRGEHRTCTDPHAGRFLRDAATLPLKSRILITSRLFPRELDDLAGCERQDLATIHPDDAVTFFHAQGIRGTRAEIQAACAPYGYHALALRLLAGVVKKNRRTPGDIKVASQYPVLPELKGKEQHHILQVAYDQLDQPKRALLSRLAAFRSPMPYDALAALNNYTATDRFDRALDELEERGLLFFDREQARYDMHPVVRGYAYDHLNDKSAIHTRLRDYFMTSSSALPGNISSIKDAAPLIELYYHTVKAGQYDTAWQLYSRRLRQSLYYQLGEYEQDIQLLLSIPRSEDGLPMLSSAGSSMWNLLYLGMCYERTARIKAGVDVASAAVSFARFKGYDPDLSEALVPFSMVSCEYGNLQLAEMAASEACDLLDSFGNNNWKGISHRCRARILTIKGQYSQAAKEYARVSEEYQPEAPFIHGRSVLLFYQAIHNLWQSLPEYSLDLARKSEKLAQSGYYKREEIGAKWIIALSLMDIASHAPIVERNHTLLEAESHLTEALIHCRRINLVELEPGILLAWARWHQLQGNAAQARADADEALAIADRCESRLKQADIHNFLARLALDAGDRAAARREAEIAKERAWCDGPPHCYKPALDEAERLLEELERGA